MIQKKMRSPININFREALTLSKFAENTGRMIYIRKNARNKFLTLNSIIGLLSMKIRKGNSITLLCEGADGQEILETIAKEFESLS